MAAAFTHEVLLQHDKEPVPYPSGTYVRAERDLRYMDDRAIIGLLKSSRRAGVVHLGVISPRARYAWYKVERKTKGVVVVRSVREPLRAILRPLEAGQ